MRTTLLGDLPAHRVSLVVNTPSGAGSVVLDHLRFGGTLTKRTRFHREALDTTVATTPFLSFEVEGDWTNANGAARRALGPALDGAAMLEVASGGWVPVVSRWFSTTELPEVTGKLGVDVVIPDPQPNPWWTGDVHLYVECPTGGLYNTWVGRHRRFWRSDAARRYVPGALQRDVARARL